MKIFHGFKVNFQQSRCKFVATRDEAIGGYSFAGGVWLIYGEADSQGYYSQGQAKDVTRAEEQAFVHYSETYRNFIVSDTMLKASQVREYLDGRININCHLSLAETLIEMGFQQILV